MQHRPAVVGLTLCLVAALSGCDALGIETPGMANAKKEAEGNAIGAACRHALRSIEDCHNANPRVSKAYIFDGWREMDAYMRENNLEGMPSAGTPTGVAPPEEVVTPASAPASATTPAPVANAPAAATTGRTPSASGAAAPAAAAAPPSRP